MSDGLLAAIIAAGATVLTSLVQLRTSLAKEFAARTQSSALSRRKSRLLPMLMIAMLGGAAVGGFAVAQWLHEYERVAQQALQRDLRERLAEASRTNAELGQSRAAVHAEIEAGILRRIGAEGVAVLATVAPCRLQAGIGTPASPSPAAASAPASANPSPQPSPGPCSERDASPVTLCATIPTDAKLTDVELYVRADDAAGPWSASRAIPGQETEQARFAEQPAELADGAAGKRVCEAFVQWSARPRTARMVVHYAL